MRHRKKTIKLGRTAAHRDAMLANQVCSLIEHSRIRTTLAKAKAARPLAEKMVTLGRAGTIHARRVAFATLGNKAAVKKLFAEVAPRTASRKGGYTRIVKLGPRRSDAAPMALLEWVDAPAPKDDETIEVTPGRKAKGEPTAKAPKAAPAPKPSGAADAPDAKA